MTNTNTEDSVHISFSEAKKKTKWLKSETVEKPLLYRSRFAPLKRFGMS